LHEATQVESPKLCFVLQCAMFRPENIVQSIAVAFEHCLLCIVTSENKDGSQKEQLLR